MPLPEGALQFQTSTSRLRASLLLWPFALMPASRRWFTAAARGALEIMATMATLLKLRKADKVAILSPSFAAPGKWPHRHALGLQRLREIFALEPVEYPTTAKLGASMDGLDTQDLFHPVHPVHLC